MSNTYMNAAIGALAAALMGCGAGGDKSAESPEDEQLSASEPTCPAGTEERGGAPPDYYASWCERPDGTKHGPYATWFDNDVLSERGTYVDGLAHGIVQSWFPDGSWRGINPYRYGVEHGMQLGASLGGIPSTLYYAADGRKHGPAAAFHPNGELAQLGVFDDGVRAGTWYAFHEDGSRRQRTTYVGDAKHGEETFWDHNGAVVATMSWQDGEPR